MKAPTLKQKAEKSNFLLQTRKIKNKREVNKVSKFVPTDISFSSAILHKVSVISVPASPAGNQVFKYVSLWGALSFNSLNKIVKNKCTLKEV